VSVRSSTRVYRCEGKDRFEPSEKELMLLWEEVRGFTGGFSFAEDYDGCHGRSIAFKEMGIN
jgi:hypothetical protein